ncbi:homeodomain-interacting protein kinase 2-like [Solea solea]|uniref:homeodomain-interacting protein kinase 2-like n=1 Tax=Solea solea TaxID=90069 RepID=UPI00272B4F7B|nr:homeodomain-interacting protein kinase 2-like [Solea solea]
MTVGQAFNKSSEYHMIKALGKGSFGVVYKCIRQDTKEMVALKSLRKNYAWIGEREAGILKSLNQCCHGTRNVVKLNRHFMISDDFFLEFEMLDMTISQFMVKYARPMHMYEIQAIAQQTVEALDTLKSISVVHLDLKPDNIMFIDHKLHPMKVKVIDFGLATLVSNMTQGKRFQASSYRAPEVTLGLNLNEAVDMWSLGCVLAFMYLRSHLFSRVLCEHQVTREIVQIFGLPENHLLDSGVCTRENFLKDGDSWRLVEMCNCEKRTNAQNKWKFSCLHDIVLTRPHTSDYEDTQAFVNLLKEMMQVNPKKRVTPQEALNHPFFTVKNFPSDSMCSMEERSASLTEEERRQEECNIKIPKLVEVIERELSICNDTGEIEPFVERAAVTTSLHNKRTDQMLPAAAAHDAGDTHINEGRVVEIKAPRRRKTVPRSKRISRFLSRRISKLCHQDCVANTQEESRTSRVSERGNMCSNRKELVDVKTRRSLWRRIWDFFTQPLCSKKTDVIE